jgi:hypothetical protein
MAIQTTATDVHLRSSQPMGLLATTPFSVACWMNCTWNPGVRHSFVGIYGPSTDVSLGAPVTAMQIGTSTGNNELTCWTWGGGTLVGTANGAMAGFNGVWVFITYTFDGTTHRLYRNGVQLVTSTTAQQAGFLNQVYINGFPGSITGEVAAFQVDQYTLYRHELSADEVLSMYNAAGARHGNQFQMIARYEFDELGQGVTTSSVVDMSGSVHGLTVTGAGTPITYTYPSTYANSNIRPVQ